MTTVTNVEPDDVEPKRSNYFVRHWRGELSLPISFWVNGWVISIVLKVVDAVEADAIHNGELIPFAALAFFVFDCAAYLWQIVGIWRSATRYEQHETKGALGSLAKFLVVIGVIITAWTTIAGIVSGLR